jgi:2-methylcitrate dehydratase PrpD
MTDHGTRVPDRRHFLMGTAATLGALGFPDLAFAQNADGKKLTALLGDFIAGFDLKSVPADVVDRARVGFIDTVGVMLAGSHEEVAHLAVEMVKAENAAGAASIVGQSVRSSPQLAALANGVAAHAMDYDFTFLSGQSVSPVIPAILPLAEATGASPSDCVGAFIVGCEVAARLVRSSPRISNDGGWHTTGVVGSVAAAAASAKLLKVPAERIPNVLGIAVSLASGVAVNYGTMTKPLHSGNAARNGVLAATLGKSGFTSHPLALEGTAGFFATFARGLSLSTEPFRDLGRRWDLAAIGYSIKAYPCGGRGHTAIEAALALREKAKLDEVANIHCQVSASSAERINTQWPVDVEAAKFSAAYVIAYSLVHGAPRIPAFTEQALKDERVRAMAKLVTAAPDSSLSDAFGESPAKLKITLKNGQAFEHRQDYATGSQKRPMTQAQLEEKFLDCAAQAMNADVSKKILATLNALPNQRSFDDLWPLLRKVG